MKNLLLLLITSIFLFLGFMPYAFACDDASAEIINIIDVGGGNYEFEFYVCIEYLGLEATPYQFGFGFNPTTINVQPGFTPTSVYTSDNDNYVGTIENGGNELNYIFGSLYPYHNSSTNCFTSNITVDAYPTSVLVTVNEQAISSYPSCGITLPIPPIPPIVSPCECDSGTSCDGSTFADQTAAVNAYSGENAATPSSACYDLTSFDIPVDDGEVYEFCYEYTHTSTENEFSFNSLIGMTNTGTCLNTSTTSQSVYLVGACATALTSTGSTTDGWPVYTATTNEVYRICTTVDPDELECCGEILSVCTYVHPTGVVCDFSPVPQADIIICPGGNVSLSAVYTGTPTGAVTYSWSPAALLDTPTSATATMTDTSSPQLVPFTVTMNDGLCDITDNVTVTILPASDPACISGCVGSVGYIND